MTNCARSLKFERELSLLDGIADEFYKEVLREWE